MRVTIDEQACVGAGQCVLSAPEVFDQRDDDGIVVLLDKEPAASLHSVTRDAATRCPALAIAMTES